MAYEFGNQWTKPAPEQIHIIIVGHRVKSRCAVGNILFKAPLYSRRSMFKYRGENHRELICRTKKLERTGVQLFNVVVAPDLKTKYWKIQLKSRTLHHVYTKKVFLYVTDADDGTLFADDIYMQEIREHFGYHKTWIIPIICCSDNPPNIQELREMTTWFDSKCYSTHVAPCFLLHERLVTLINGRDLMHIILQVVLEGKWDPKIDKSEVMQLGDKVSRQTEYSEIYGNPSMADVPVLPKPQPNPSQPHSVIYEREANSSSTSQGALGRDETNMQRTLDTRQTSRDHKSTERQPNNILIYEREANSSSTSQGALGRDETNMQRTLDTRQTSRDHKSTERQPNYILIYERGANSSSTSQGALGRDETNMQRTLDTRQTSRDHKSTERQPNNIPISPETKGEQVKEKKMTRETTFFKNKPRAITENDKAKYVNALKYGNTRSFHVPVMVLGPNGAGKTTLIKRLQGEITKASTLTVPTEGLEISENKLRCVKDENGQVIWEDQDEEFTENLMTERMAYAIGMNDTQSKNYQIVVQTTDTVSSGQNISPLFRAQSVKTDPWADSGADMQRKGQHSQTQTADRDFLQTEADCANTDCTQDTDGQLGDVDTSIVFEKQSQPSSNETDPAFTVRTRNNADSEYRQGLTIHESLDKEENSSDSVDDETSNDQSKQKTEAKSVSRNEETSTSKSDSLTDGNLEKAFVSLEHSRTEKLYFSFLDFAGQAAYYGTHQLFLTPSTLNILVVDLSKDLQELLDNQSFGFVMDEFGKLEMTVSESVQFWVQSIRTFSGKSKRRIIVVCSHMDKVKEDDTSRKIGDLHTLIEEYVEPEYIFVDNTKDPDTDEKFQKLKILLHVMGLELTCNEEFPTYWLELENVLRTERSKNKKIITFQQASELLLLRNGSAVKDADDIQRLQSFLCYQHSKGRLLYFPQNRNCKTILDEQSLVILDPTIVVRFLSRIMSGPKVNFETHLGKGVRTNLHQAGIFDKHFLEEAIRSDNDMMELTDNSSLILDYLETLHILCKYQEMGKSYYLMPCLLRSRSEPCQFSTALSRSTVIIIAFTPTCKHYSVFFQLMTALSQKFEVTKDPSVFKQRRRHVYRNCVCFYITPDKLLLMHLRMVDNDIYCEIINYGDQFKFGDEKEIAQCGVLLGTIKEELEKILDLYSVTLTYEFRVICPKHSDPPTPSSLPIDALQAHGKYLCEPASADRHEVKSTEILKHWFPIEDDDDLPQVKDAETQRQRILTDKDIGRMCLLVIKQQLQPCCLASKLEIRDCYPVVHRIICDNQNNVQKQLLEVFFHWKREEEDKSTIEEIARCLKLYQVTIYSLHQVCTDTRIPEFINNNEILNRTPTEQDLMKISRIIPASKMDFLFLELGLSKVEIDNTRSEEKDSTKATFQLFQTWFHWRGYEMRLTDIAFACFVMKITKPTEIVNAIEGH